MPRKRSQPQPTTAHSTNPYSTAGMADNEEDDELAAVAAASSSGSNKMIGKPLSDGQLGRRKECVYIHRAPRPG